MSEKRILVVGAGVAGLAAARTLTRAGLTAEVVERQPSWDEAGTGSTCPGTLFERCARSVSIRPCRREES